MIEHPNVVDSPEKLKVGDFQDYFLRWGGVLAYPNPANPREMKIHGYEGDGGSIPCHQHITCKGLVFASSRIPPRVCPECWVDTAKEIQETHHA